MSGNTGKQKPEIRPLKESWKRAVDDFVHVLAPSPDGTLIAVGGGAGTVWILESRTGEQVAAFEAHFPGLGALAWSADSATLATVGHDGKFKLWPRTTWETSVAVGVGRGWAEHVVKLPTGTWVAAAGKTLKALSASGEVVYEDSSFPATIAALAPAPGNRLTVATYGEVREYDAKKWGTPTLETWQGSLLSAVWSPTGNHLCCGSQEGSVQIWQRKPADRFEMSGYEGKIRRVSWEQSGRYMVTDGSQTAAVWDFSGKGPKGKSPIVHSAHQSQISDIAFRPRGPVFCSVGREGLVAVWEVRRPVPLAAFLRGNPATVCAWSPDGKDVIVGFEDGFVASFPT